MIFHIQHLCDKAKMGHDLKFKMAAMPIYGKNHSNDFFPRTTRRIWLIFCEEAYGAPRYIKYLKSFRFDHKQALIGWVKMGKMTQNFRYMNLLS